MNPTQKMKAYRVKNNLNQEEMAHKLNISQQNYSAIERGYTKLTFPFAEQWKKVTGVDLLIDDAKIDTTVKEETGMLKYLYEQLLKTVLKQEEKIKNLERLVQEVSDDTKEVLTEKAAS
jgi:DNA-binding XRE family transcriptional regulator